VRIRRIVLLGALALVMTANAHAQTQTRTRTRNPRAAQEEADDPRRVPAPAELPAGAEEMLPRIPAGLDEPVDPDTYVIGPADQFALFIKSGEEINLRLTVLPEGDVLLPNVGALQAAGLTITEFRAAVRKALSRYYHNVEIYCQLVIPRVFVVYVLGEVETPGAVELAAPFRLDAAIRAAGDITDRGSMRAIEIRSDSVVVRTADMLRFHRLGITGENPHLHEGQTVFVPSRRPFCSVIGEVYRGGIYEVLEGETIADMLELAGGTTSTAAFDRVMLERMTEGERLAVTRIPADSLDRVRVQPRDVIVIPDVRTFPGTESVRIEGGRGREGRILIEEGETIGEFINRFIRLREDHDLEKAVVERQLPDGNVEFIPVDLKKVISGENDGSLALEPGDVISVPVRDDFVYVTGEVTAPGQVSFQRGLPAGRYIALAGGPSQRGSIDRLRIYDIDGNERSGDRNSKVYRGETILVKQRKSVIFGSLFFGFTSLASLIVAVIALANTN
jgi:protein involved in polysaccharide export with SLBB domain